MIILKNKKNILYFLKPSNTKPRFSGTTPFFVYKMEWKECKDGKIDEKKKDITEEKKMTTTVLVVRWL